jgi:large subunit ribosomal protein L14e
MMNEIGRLCTKIAGRDSNKICVIVDVIDDHTVLIDGETRRRKCNVLHLEPLNKVITLKKGASHEEVKKALFAHKIEVRETKPKKAVERPKKSKINKQGTVEAKPKKEKAPKKAAAKTEKVEKKAKSDDKKAKKD